MHFCYTYMMGRLFDLVIFDLDGTLIDNRVAIRENFNHALSLHGYSEPPDSEIDSMVGMPLLEMFKKCGADDEVAPELVMAYKRRYHDTSHNGVVIFSGVIQLLESLRNNGFKLAIATTKAENEALSLLQKIGLHKYFDLVAGSTESIRPKPHPDMIHRITEKIGVAKEKTILVGDTPVDVATARNAGIKVAAVTTGVSLGFATREEIIALKPDYVMHSVSDLARILLLR